MDGDTTDAPRETTSGKDAVRDIGMPSTLPVGLLPAAYIRRKEESVLRNEGTPMSEDASGKSSSKHALLFPNKGREDAADLHVSSSENPKQQYTDAAMRGMGALSGGKNASYESHNGSEEHRRMQKRGSAELLATISHGKQLLRNQQHAPIARWILRWNFFRSVVTHLIATSLVAAGVIKAVNTDLDFIDCFFLTASAISGTGLATVSMSSITLPSFVIIYILMFLGSGIAIQLVALLFRV
jgi:ABC-type Fe3+-siderophore transport system permease subunit